MACMAEYEIKSIIYKKHVEKKENVHTNDMLDKNLLYLY